MRVVAHAVGAVTTFALLCQTSDLLGWLTWQVSSLFGKSAGMHFYSMEVSADSPLGELATRVLVVLVPILILGGIAESIEALRRRTGLGALILPVLIACIAGAVVWSTAAREEGTLLDAWVLGFSFAILCLLWMAMYWSSLAGTLRILRRRVLQTDVA